MIGFGIPINEFGIGNTLISAGTTAVVGGLVLIGLGATLRELRAVAETVQSPGWPDATGEDRALGANPPLSARLGASGLTAPPSPGPLLGRDAVLEPMRGDYVLQPRFTARPPPKEAEDREPLIRQEGPYRPAQAHDQAHDEEAEEEPRPFAHTPGANARGERSRGFDAIWPATVPEPTPAPSASHDETEAARDHDQDEAVESAASSILKSGVIDGMVYTLYTDGSIEAELPQGTLKFASIDELRDYLLNKE